MASDLLAMPRHHLKQLDGLRGPLALGVVAITMDLYNAGANTPVGFFLVLSGLTSFLAYGANEWDDASRAQFFVRRLVRLLPMLIVVGAVTWFARLPAWHVSTTNRSCLYRLCSQTRGGAKQLHRVA